MGRTLDRPVCCRVPIVDGLRGESGLGGVMGDEFGVRAGRLGKLRFQDVDNPLMVVLARPL